MSYGTYTTTYTVVDIRKAFEGFESDLRMIARRTEKWSNDYVDKIFHDVIKLAEAKYLKRVSISLKNINDIPIQATRFTVNESGTSISGERAGGNDWTNLSNTSLCVTLEYTAAWNILSSESQRAFQNGNNFRINWVASSLDTNFPNLRRESAQTYASNGYEISKDNFK